MHGFTSDTRLEFKIISEIAECSGTAKGRTGFVLYFCSKIIQAIGWNKGAQKGKHNIIMVQIRQTLWNLDKIYTFIVLLFNIPRASGREVVSLLASEESGMIKGETGRSLSWL